MMEAAHFPHQGEILNPTLQDYEVELMLVEEHAVRLRKERGDTSGYNKLIAWKRLVRRLRWMHGR